jgi:hypothetical protein
MPPTGPYSQDVLTRIVNVNWGGGLAVEFGDGADAPKPPKPPAVALKRKVTA